jgi:lipoprotein signal peptidase
MKYQGILLAVGLLVLDQLLATYIYELHAQRGGLPLVSLLDKTFFATLCLALLYVLSHKPAGAFLLMATGLVSNVITVTRFGQVIDYLPLGHHVYTNGADLMISVGATWLVLSMFATRPKPS